MPVPAVLQNGTNFTVTGNTVAGFIATKTGGVDGDDDAYIESVNTIFNYRQSQYFQFYAQTPDTRMLVGLTDEEDPACSGTPCEWDETIFPFGYIEFVQGEDTYIVHDGSGTQTGSYAATTLFRIIKIGVNFVFLVDGVSKGTSDAVPDSPPTLYRLAVIAGESDGAGGLPKIKPYYNSFSTPLEIPDTVGRDYCQGVESL